MEYSNNSWVYDAFFRFLVAQQSLGQLLLLFLPLRLGLMLTPGGDAAGRGERRAQGHLGSGGAVKGSREITFEMEAIRNGGWNDGRFKTNAFFVSLIYQCLILYFSPKERQ